MIAVDDLESLEETLAILQDEQAMQEIARAGREVAAGDTVDVDGLKKMMARRPRTQ